MCARSSVVQVWVMGSESVPLPTTGKLLGMNETSATITMAEGHCSSAVLNKQVRSMANLGEVITGHNNTHR